MHYVSTLAVIQCVVYLLHLFSFLLLLSAPPPPPATIAVLHNSCKRARDSRGQLLQELKVRACVCLRVCVLHVFARVCCVFECVDRSFVSQEQRGRAAAAASRAGGCVQLLQVGVL